VGAWELERFSIADAKFLPRRREEREEEVFATDKNQIHTDNSNILNTTKRHLGLVEIVSRGLSWHQIPRIMGLFAGVGFDGHGGIPARSRWRC
jgi:hypothetical protein